ncbi:LOB domain-containing protein 39-like [Mangifera indica]|uniref:LOB domain-containing protein 39-like n=1 Tax=Mangifera indica TaxID=29780 RepID=UPI001CFBFC25|nr:LOB domain-containing protein 39-like [Mangifera indica]
MSCNGCRVLRKGCSETCILRTCLQWIDSPEAQGNATLFLAKFFGRSDLLSFIAAVPETQRPALFQSLLFEACGRTVNPVNGAVGLLSSGNWHLCQAAVETVLAGGTLRPISGHNGVLRPNCDESSGSYYTDAFMVKSFHAQSRPLIIHDGKDNNRIPDVDLSQTPRFGGSGVKRGRGKGWQRAHTMSFYSEESVMTSLQSEVTGKQERKLLNLFV